MEITTLFPSNNYISCADPEWITANTCTALTLSVKVLSDLSVWITVESNIVNKASPKFLAASYGVKVKGQMATSSLWL